MVKNKVFLFGLDFSGKTSIINSMNKIKNPGDTKPTLRLSTYNLIIHSIEFILWDAPGQVAFRKHWDKGIFSARILCLIIDITTPERFNELQKELNIVLENKDSNNLPLIICFHKVDLIEARKNLDEAKKVFDIEQFADRTVTHIETSIFNPDSILELKNLFVQVVKDSLSS